MDSGTENTAFADFPAEAFPLLIEYFNAAGECVHSNKVEGPGVLYVPPLAEIYGPVSIRMTLGNGFVAEAPPPPPESRTEEDPNFLFGQTP